MIKSVHEGNRVRLSDMLCELKCTGGMNMIFRRKIYSFNCTDPNVGLALNGDRTYLKCYMGDTGGDDNVKTFSRIRL